MPDVAIRHLRTSLAQALAGPPAPGTRLFWLGQAGFAIEAAGHRLLIDPYLSDSLAAKYRGGRFPHERLMPPPVTTDRLGQLDLVLATHSHTDHMDAGTLIPLFAARPNLRLVAPSAAREAAMARAAIADDRLALMDAGECLEVLPGILVTATPAAHETRELDAAGHHRFLGYAVRADGRTLWHSGDCVPFDGLAPSVSPLAPTSRFCPSTAAGPNSPGTAFRGISRCPRRSRSRPRSALAR